MGSESDTNMALIGHKLDQVLATQGAITDDLRVLNAAHAETREEMISLPMRVLHLSDEKFARKESVQTINRTFLAVLVAVVLGAGGIVYEKIIEPIRAAEPETTVSYPITEIDPPQPVFSEPLARAREYAPAQVQ